VHAGNGTQDIVDHLGPGSRVALFSAHCKGDVYPEGASDQYAFPEDASPDVWKAAARALLRDLVAFLDAAPARRPRLLVVRALPQRGCLRVPMQASF